MKPCQCVCAIPLYGGWLGPLSAILQFQLHSISTLFPLWILYFHSTSTLNFRFHSVSTLLPPCFHSISTLDFCFHSISTLVLYFCALGEGDVESPIIGCMVGRVGGPLTLKPVVGPRIFLEHHSAGCRGSANSIAS